MAYADDIILLAPSSSGLQILLNRLCELLHGLCLPINIDKSVYIVFRGRKCIRSEAVVTLSGLDLKRVSECKYLGVVFSENLSCIDKDMDRVLNSFLAQFNSMYQKFSFLDRHIVYFLFKTYTSSFYGVEMWYNGLKNDRTLHKLSVGYHKAVKKIAGLNPWDGNHGACEEVGVDIFKHLQAKRMISLYFKTMNSENRFLHDMRYYFRFASAIKIEIENFFEKNYGITRLSSNPKCAIMARIDFIQRHEPRSCYVY